MEVVFSKEITGLGEKIKNARLASTKSATQLAAEAEISVPHWNRIENEKVGKVPLVTIRKIERALGVNLDLDLLFNESMTQ